MTREEASQIIQALRLQVEEPTDTGLGWLETWIYKEDVEALRMAIKALEQEPRWIPVSERLPEDSGEYLVSVVDEEDKNSWYKQVEVAWFAHKKDYDIKESEWRELGIDEKVIAWMSLPKAYREVEE